MKKNLKPMIISALTAIAMGTIGVGTTFALFTDKAETSISVKAGIVEGVVSYDNLKAYSLDETNNLVQKEVTGGYFATKGTYALDATQGTVTLTNMVPGDKIEFDIAFKNKSNVDTKYRLKVRKTGLLSQYLNASFTNGTLTWAELDPSNNLTDGQLVETTHVVIELPNTSNEITAREEGFDNGAQGLTASYVLAYEMVQGNANVVDDAATVGTFIEANTVNADPSVTGGEYPFTFESNDGLVLMSGTGEDIDNPVVVTLDNADPSDATFSIEGVNTASYEIKAVNTKDGAPVTVSIYAGEGYDYMYVFHRNDKMTLDIDGNLQVGEYSYNKATGYVTLKTTEFSPFHFRGANDKINFVYNWDELKAAIAEGGEYVLADNIEAESLAAFNGKRYPVEKDIVINGAGHKITVNQRGFGIQASEVTFKNVEIVNNTAGGRAIDVRPDSTHIVEKLSIIDSKISAPTKGSINNQPLTFGGSQSTAIDVLIKNSTICTAEDGSLGYAIIAFNPINARIENSTIAGWGCFYMKGPDSSTGTAGSSITMIGGNIISKNIYSNTSNAFGAIKIEDDVSAQNGVNFNFTGVHFDINTSGDQYQGVFALPHNALPTCNLYFRDGCTFDFKSERSLFGLNILSDESQKVYVASSLLSQLNNHTFDGYSFQEVTSPAGYYQYVSGAFAA